MNKYLAFSITLAAAVSVGLFLSTATVPAAFCQTSEHSNSGLLPKPGERVPLDPDHYFVYGFDKTPKLGTAIMKVEIFARNGDRDTTFVVKGDVDMPSMRGAHSTGDKQFSVSKKGVYLLPAPIAMPGEWEFKFTFEKDGKAVFRGVYRFEV